MSFQHDVIEPVVLQPHDREDKEKQDHVDREEGRCDGSDLLVIAGAVLEVDNGESIQVVLVLEHLLEFVVEHGHQESQEKHLGDVDEQRQVDLPQWVSVVRVVLVPDEPVEHVQEGRCERSYSKFEHSLADSPEEDEHDDD